ncbi:hypothetical protein QYF36_007930 [Acer negundo]|nr:hypothetical protein QYF36_007930 [Acer negundo]
MGILIRDHGGTVLSSCSLFLDTGLDFVSSIAFAILKGVQFGKCCGLLPLCVESDSSMVVKLINLRNHSSSGCGNIVSDILTNMSDMGLSSISAGKKGSKKAAFALAYKALSRGNDLFWGGLRS